MSFCNSATLPIRPAWARSVSDGLTFYQSSVLLKQNVTHAFTTRTGGCSQPPYESLNLGSHVGDLRSSVDENRRRVAQALNMLPDRIVTAGQLHGAEVGVATGEQNHFSEADALITDQPDILLMLMFADCVPILIFDSKHTAVSVIHSGWKGTAKNIVRTTLSAMTSNYGTDTAACTAIIGPCISVEKYEVSAEVAANFQSLDNISRGFSPTILRPYNTATGSCLLNLRSAVRQQLILEGFGIESIVVSDDCTLTNANEFFSHRRDGTAQEATGRMAAVIGIQPKHFSGG